MIYQFDLNLKKFLKKRKSDTYGDDSIGDKKKENGLLAEKRVQEFFKSKGIDVLDVANDKKYPYDLHFLNHDIGLEVKNISSGQFFISDNEINAYKKHKTRICFVDMRSGSIHISVLYSKSNYFKKIICDIEKIKDSIIEGFGGIYSASEIAIGLIEEQKNAIKEDFVKVNELEYSQLIEVLQKG